SVIRNQISSAIDIIIHLMRLRDKSRKIVGISEITGMENGEIKLNPLYEFVEEGETETGEIIGGLKPTRNTGQNRSKANLAGVERDEEKVWWGCRGRYPHHDCMSRVNHNLHFSGCEKKEKRKGNENSWYGK